MIYITVKNRSPISCGAAIPQDDQQTTPQTQEYKDFSITTFDKDTYAKRKEELKGNFISEKMPAYVQKFDYLVNIPARSKPYFAQNTEEIKLKIAKETQRHVILTGAAGTGKTELVIKLAHENQIPIFKFSCSNDVRMEDLIGSKTISEDGNTIIFQAGMLLKAVLTANECGKAILLLDEINTLSEKVQKNINGLADGTGFIDLPFGKVQINAGVFFMICGTMNLSYAGTNPLNPELKDRFVIIDMPKTTKETKYKIYEKYAIPKDVKDNIIILADRLEEMQKYNKVSGDVVFSTRSQMAFFELYQEMLYQGINKPEIEALDMALVSKFDDTNDKDEIRRLVNEVFA